jgi:hypothetical protein
MRTANLSDAGLLIQVDVQELRILAAALNALCNVGDILEQLEQRRGGTKEKAEMLLVSIRSLNALFERLAAQAEAAVPEPVVNEGDTFPLEPACRNSCNGGVRSNEALDRSPKS